MKFLVVELIVISIQFLLFVPFYFIWRKDCKEIGKENLAVSLKERFTAWLLFCPMWAVPIIALFK